LQGQYYPLRGTHTVTYSNMLTVKRYQNKLTTLNRRRANIITAASLIILYSSCHTIQNIILAYF